MNTPTLENTPGMLQIALEKLEKIERMLQEQKIEPCADKILQIRGAAEFLGLTVQTIYGKVSKNEIPYIKQGKRLLFSEKDLREYLLAGRRKANFDFLKD
ncbi:MAG: helix-turn-helix domain-containing protein [Leadbetterella sp.]|nr:helix-turn-helix domain-containing protein [Leadbetterella sp.]